MSKKASDFVLNQAGQNTFDSLIVDGLSAEKGSDQRSKKVRSGLVARFVEEVMGNGGSVGAETVRMITDRIAQIDSLLSAQIDEVIHHPEFQRLEATWRGLASLMASQRASDAVRISIVSISLRDLTRALSTGSESDCLELLHYVVDNSANSRVPFGMFVTDSILSDRSDRSILRVLSKLSASTNAPLLTAVAPQFVGLSAFSKQPELDDLSDESADRQEMARSWTAFLSTPEAKFVAVGGPRVAMRAPYNGPAADRKEFTHRENTENTSRMLWGSPVWSLALSVVHSFNADGWFSGALSAAISPSEDDARTAGEKPINDTEIEFPSLHRSLLVREQLFGLVEQSNRIPKRLHEFRALFCACRFAHYLVFESQKEIREGRIDDLIEFLRRRLSKYLQTGTSPDYQDARHPLFRGDIRLVSHISEQSRYLIEFTVQPAFHLQNRIETTIRLQVWLGRASSRPEVSGVASILAIVPSQKPNETIAKCLAALNPRHRGKVRPIGEAWLALGRIVARNALEDLVDFFASESSSLSVDISRFVSSSTDASHWAFLAVYPSGTVRSLDAAIELSRDQRQFLTLFDPSAILDPGHISEDQITDEIRCEFDVVPMEIENDE